MATDADSSAEEELRQAIEEGPLDRQMAVLWASDWVAISSAYATQSERNLRWLNSKNFPGIVADHVPLTGHENVIFERETPWPYKVWTGEKSANGQQFGGDTVTEAFYRGNYDFVICLKDALQWLPRWHNSPIPKVMYVPVPSDPAPPSLFQSIERAPFVWCPSRNGVEQLEENGIDATYMPHHVDQATFRPLRDDDPIDRAQIRAPADLGPDDYVVGFVGLNRGERKDIGRVIRAFNEWRIEYNHAEARLHLHTEPTPPSGGGIDIPQFASKIGIPNTHIEITDPWKKRVGYTSKQMVQFYLTLDCYLGIERGAGFAMPPLEANACGVPAVVTDHAAMRERIVDGENGYRVSPIDEEVNWMTGTNAIPSVEATVETLESVYQRDWDSEAIHRSVIPEYDVRTVLVEHMAPALNRVMEGFYPEDDPL